MKPSTVEALQRGVRNFLSDYLNLSAGQTALMVGHNEPRDVMEALSGEARELGVQLTLAPADSFDTLSERFQAFEVVVYLEQQSSTHKAELLNYLKQRQLEGAKDSTRFYRCFDFSVELFERSLAVPRDQLQQINDSIIGVGLGTKSVHVTNDAGTDLSIGLDQKYGWVDSCAYFDGYRPGVFPPSEVATFSDRVDGILVAAGAINTNFGFPGDPRLESHPVRVEFRDSKVIEWHCEDPVVTSVLTHLFSVPNCARVGKVGFGTNIGTSRFVSFLSHINERYPCLHLGLGGNNQGKRSQDGKLLFTST